MVEFSNKHTLQLPTQLTRSYDGVGFPQLLVPLDLTRLVSPGNAREGYWLTQTRPRVYGTRGDRCTDVCEVTTWLTYNIQVAQRD